MKEYKRLKDPIYGYINLEKKMIEKVIDTAGFQRLRSVIQTSYSPVYPSAVHNRFVHSLGVYHLGQFVVKAIRQGNDGYENVEDINRWLDIYSLACLLHDVGHAPFSHTGEEYYLDNGERTKLHKMVVELTEDYDLEQEIKQNNYKAAPHELMSVVVSLKDYGDLFNNAAEKSFFARCICGYKYTSSETRYTFLNCLISCLNSDVIDVDKLDYLIRDAYITGFDTVVIDYERLLNGICIRKLCQGEKIKYCIVYKKDAISVIENVMYAHDAERKWIQNHPIVQYEIYLQTRAIDAIIGRYKGIDLFSYDSLTEKGVKLSEDYKISLLSDDDIVFLMKNTNEYVVKEYFSRSLRRHPLWKSESEYKAFFNDIFTGEMFDKLEKSLDDLCKYLNFTNRSQEINGDAYQACQKDIDDTEKLLKESNNDNKYQVLLNSKRTHLAWLEVLREFADEQKIEFDFVIIRANQFNSGFAKKAFSEIKIEFPALSEFQNFGDVTNVLKADKSVRDKFFYVFYRREDKDQNIDVLSLVEKFAHTAISEVTKKRKNG